MLAVISNLAPLYTRGATGDSILRAASEVQMLTYRHHHEAPGQGRAVRVINKGPSPVASVTGRIELEGRGR